MFNLNADADPIHLDVTEEQRDYLVIVLAEMTARLCNQRLADPNAKQLTLKIYELLLQRQLDVEHLQHAADEAFRKAQEMEGPQKGIPIERKQHHQAVVATLKASAHAAYAVVNLYEEDQSSSRLDADSEHVSTVAVTEYCEHCQEAAMQQLIAAVQHASAAMAAFVADDLCSKIERMFNQS